MWTLIRGSTMVSIWNIFLIVCCINTVRAWRTQEKKSGIKLPCDPKRVEIAFPIIEDSLGRQTPVFYSQTSPRDLLHVTVKWRRQPLRIILYKTQLTSAGSFSEWEEGNLTYARTIDQSCSYHGYIKGERTSYVALSTCGGLGGYIQTDQELLYVQSRLDIDPHQERAPHLLYTCEAISRKPQTSRSTSTAGTLRRRRRKRAATRTRYLEVQLVVDYKLVQAIGNQRKTENYVMALMNIVMPGHTDTDIVKVHVVLCKSSGNECRLLERYQVIKDYSNFVSLSDNIVTPQANVTVVDSPEANTLYQHSTLGQDIRLVVVRIIFLKKNQQRDVVSRGQALRTVNKFCRWSVENAPRPVNYDISVLITDEVLGPSGFAPITGLCNPIRSCAAIHDDGFSTGFVIAHEMAHVFGVFHDGHGNKCYGNKYTTSVMAAVVASKFNHFWWSECSKRKMADLVRFIPCINNVPNPIANHYPLKAKERIKEDLGTPWSLNFQCEREFGTPYQLCKAFGNDPCNVLWCASRRNPYYCRTKRGPPLTGSRCGPDMECHSNRCQYVGNRSPVNGRWSSWSRWSECSSGCGVGMRERRRACNSPTPKYGGEDCTGDTKIRTTCFNNKCESYTDMRAGECTVWDGLQIRYGTHKWLPFEPVNASTICKQTCKSFYTRQIVTIEVDVSDGTPCSYLRSTSDVCLNGKCALVGCDGVQNSTKKMDACGICGGDGSKCKVIEGIFKHKAKSARQYLKVVRIPSNAKNITVITLNKTSNHFLALRDAAYGKEIFNGDKKQSRSEDLVLKGAMFYYKRGSRTQDESIHTPGPIHGHVDLMVYSKRRSTEVSILFRYTTHKKDMTYEKDRFKWKFLSWSDCSVTCGEGIQFIQHNCVNKQTDEIVDKESCAALEAPRRDEVKCTRQSCADIRFNFGMLNTFTKCDAKCGEKGTKLQEYACERYYVKSKKYKKVEMKFCGHLKAPVQKRECRGDPCQNEERVTYEWNVPGQWSKCTAIKTCGLPGHQTRVAQCITIRGKRRMVEEVVVDSKCNASTKPEVTKMCGVIPCPKIYKWFSGERWSKCACGGPSTQIRKVVCHQVQEIDGKNKVRSVGAKQCRKAGKRPTSSRQCDGGPCPPKFRWINKEDQFEPCDAKCGAKGKERSLLVCQQIVVWKGDEIIETVDGSFCESEKKPQRKTRFCHGPPCVPTFRWKATDNWTECEAKCEEEHVQYLIYKCQKSIRNEPFVDAKYHLCNDVKRDNTTKICKGALCPLEWQVEDWSECSVTCGRGRKYRTVYCGNPETDSDDGRCKNTPPAMSKRCKMRWCPEPSADICTKDALSFCSFYTGLDVKCQADSFLKKCCKTCEPYAKKLPAKTSKLVMKTKKKAETVKKSKKKRALKSSNKTKSRSRRSKSKRSMSKRSRSKRSRSKRSKKYYRNRRRTRLRKKSS